MTNLSLAAQAIRDAYGDFEAANTDAMAAAMRSAAEHLTDATSSHTLYAIADELEGITYDTYRCNLEAQ